MLSAIIITHNEEKNIERSLRSISFADETIVVDSQSTDSTVAIAKRLGARTFIHPWPGYGKQKNFGMRKANGEWLLFIDADEQVTPQLAARIQEITKAKNPRYQLYWIRIVTVFLGKPLTHLHGHNPRLFKKSFANWTNAKVHEQVERKQNSRIVKLEDADTDTLSPPLLHHSHATISSYIRKMHFYTTLDAEQMVKTNKHRSGKTVQPNFFLPLRLSVKQLLKLLIYKKGILDGWQGWVWSFLSAYYEYEMARKYINLCA